MIKKISEDEFRRATKKYGNEERARDIEQFVKSGENACEVVISGNRTAESTAASLTTTIRRMKVPVRVCRHKERVFLVRKEWDENA